jgi:hypothetical protein
MEVYDIYIRWGGLMEDPNFRWEFHGVGYGITPEKACDELYTRKNSSTYDSKSKRDWGMVLGYENRNGEIVKFKNGENSIDK